MTKKPLILSPAGSYECLIAALDAGADEVYFGLSGHNARQNAKNFTAEETKDALRKCRLRGVKSNITLNTLVTDREMLPACRMAYDALCMGADAFIVQDAGLASALKKAIPEITLHASTQCACHSKSGALQLAEMGFERVVLAREMSAEDIGEIVKTGIETEIFVHGALCVCHSGMCLMSSVIGKRSGNRGLCAQPCRLPYNLGTEKASGRYPLSLKDLSLAMHINELSDLGVTSLKIEGRMKPPEYVSGVTSIWKTLVTENRNATPEEYRYLEKLFSRSGFTDGYFTENYLKNNKTMYGVRTDEDKADSRNVKPSEPCAVSKREITMHCSLSENKAPVLTLETDGFSHSEIGDFTVQTALSRPMSAEDINASLTKLGDTEFMYTGIHTEISGNVFVPKAQLNALRRNAVSGLEEKIMQSVGSFSFDESVFALQKADRSAVNPLLRLYPTSADSLEKMLSKYNGYAIESVCIPLGMFTDDLYTGILKIINRYNLKFGVKLPRVVFTKEEEKLSELLEKSKENGASYAVAENIGHVIPIKKSGLSLYAGAAMNIFNSYSVKQCAELGFESVTLSSELLTAQMRDMEKHGIKTAVIASGCLELMVLESCVIRANLPCKKTPDGNICHTLCDRTGAIFPVKCEHRLDTEYPCRNIVMNGIPVHLIDKPDELIKTGADVYCIYETY